MSRTASSLNDQNMKEKIFFWATVVLILVISAISSFFALRKATTPPKDNGVVLTDLTDALKNPTAAFRLDLKYVANGTTSISADGVASTTGTSTQITEIPAATFSLTNLKLLDFAGNLITNVPSTIGNLKNLQVIYLGNNQLTSIPDAICSLPQLNLLSLFHNKITALPSCISGMKSLTMIGLSGNPIPTSTVIELRKEMASTTIIF